MPYAKHAPDLLLHCTDQELADWFGVTTRTIERRRTEPAFAAVMERGKSKGKISLRRAQMRLVEQGNAVMSIFLGKQWLGQVDQVSHEINCVQIAVLPQGAPLPQLEFEDVLDIEATR